MFRRGFFVVALLLLGGCAGSHGAAVSPGSPASAGMSNMLPATMRREAVQQMFRVAYCTQTGVYVLAMPYSGPPTQLSTTGCGDVEWMDSDASGNIYLQSGSRLTIFQPPYTTTSSVSYTLPDAKYVSGEFAFDPGGNIFGCGNAAQAFEGLAPAPYAIESFLPSVPCSGAANAAVRMSGEYMIVDSNSGTVAIYAPPYTTPLQTLTVGTITSRDNIAVSPYGEVAVTGANLYYFASPTATPVKLPVTNPTAVGFDQNDNLYVTIGMTGTVEGFGNPYTTLSTPFRKISSCTGWAERLRFDRNGDLFAAGGSGVCHVPAGETTGTVITTQAAYEETVAL